MIPVFHSEKTGNTTDENNDKKEIQDTLQDGIHDI